MFVCDECGSYFALSKNELRKYRGHTPRQCAVCKSHGLPGSNPAQQLVMNAVIDHVIAAPESGIFTHGVCRPNPGPGGWAAVRIAHDQIMDERHDAEAHSTSYRMELRALVEAFATAGRDETVTIYSPGEISVNVVNRWATTWERNGWQNTNGQVRNVDLVKQLLVLSRARPNVSVRWLHTGTSKWSDYAQALARRPGDPVAS